MSLVLAGDVLNQYVVLAADLGPTNAADPNLNLGLWSTVAGFLTPLAVAVINQPRWSPFVRALLTVVFCVAVAAATTALEGKLDGDRWLTSSLLVLVAAITSYQTLWKNVAPAVESATSPKSPPAAS
jgi:hypothetical protein